MKLKIKLVAMSLTLCFVLASCGKTKMYYENTELKEFETFTSVTGVELVSWQKTEGEYPNVVYNYIMNNDADGIAAMAKWNQYIAEYGFIKEESLSMGDIEVYVKDGYILGLVMSQPTDATIQYVVTVPAISVIQEETQQNNGKTVNSGGRF